MNDNDKNNEQDEKLLTPHDRFFKSTFSNLEVTADFLENYLPEPILKLVDLKTLEIQKDSFVDEKLKEFSSDMLFKTTINQREGYLYFLFEHKSYSDRMVALQLFIYIARIWDQKVNKENDTHIPVVIPMVIYHGKSQWRIGPMLSDLILDYDTLPEEIRQMTPDFRYQLYDLSQFSDEDIKGKVKLAIALSLFRDMPRKRGLEFMDTILNAARALRDLEKEEKGIEYFKICMNYIVKAEPGISIDQLDFVIEQLEDTYKEGSEVVMTLAESLREQGRKEIRDIERYEGKRELAVEFATNRLIKKFGFIPDDYRVEITKLNLNSLEMLNYEIDDFKSINDVKKYLPF